MTSSWSFILQLWLVSLQLDRCTNEIKSVKALHFVVVADLPLKCFDREGLGGVEKVNILKQLVKCPC